ncbi:MAG: hypothetical protein ABIN91_10395 [Mucilaginibacter sp.]|uniref:hypothetical protein n=1 Tax=Mucilaginibacter sp. TaxID=1882438 RepID=UPI003264B380
MKKIFVILFIAVLAIPVLAQKATWRACIEDCVNAAFDQIEAAQDEWADSTMDCSQTYDAAVFDYYNSESNDPNKLDDLFDTWNTCVGDATTTLNDAEDAAWDAEHSCNTDCGPEPEE